MNPTINELKERKSVRIFENRKISEEDEEIILQSAIEAPTAGNQMLYSIINVKNKSLKNELSITCDNQGFINEAPLVLIFLADTRRWYDSYVHAGILPRKPLVGDLFLAIEDAMIAAQNSVVAAWSMGIGSCYIGDILENREKVMKLLHLDEYVVPITMVVYGYPTANQTRRKKPKRFNKEYIVFEDEYRRMSKEEHIKMFTERSEDENFDFYDFIGKFHKRKYASNFSLEMSRSSLDYLKFFQEE